MKTIAIIGTGIMGAGMATNFLKHGYSVIIWNRHPEKLQPLIEKGARVAVNPKEAAAQADILFEVTATDESSRAVWLGEEGILAGAKQGSALIASGTLSLHWIDELAQLCANAGFTFFDMPLTGSRLGAETGTLALLIGGDEKKLQEIDVHLQAISERRFYFGPPGSGMRFKLVLNSLQATHVAAFGEALRLAKNMGLDVQKVGDVLSERPGGTGSKLAWRDYQKIPDKTNFAVEWILKDLKYASENTQGIETSFLKTAMEQYQKAVNQGRGGEDWTIVNRD